MKIEHLFQTDDWKNEKHVPVIECPEKVKADEFFDVKVSLGKEIAHPNTTEHHIRWIRLYYKPEEDRFSYEVANFEFVAHGESVQGADKGPVYVHHEVSTRMKVNKRGHLVAIAHCNIHGLWENKACIVLE
jgi:superoxide reductase